MRTNILLLCFVVFCTPLWAAEQTWMEKYAEQPYLALLNEYTTTIKPDWSYEENYHTRVKIQQEEAKELSQWPIYYNQSRDTISSIEAFVENPDGRRYKAEQIDDLPVYEDLPMYGDLRMKVVTLPKVEIGSTIEITVKSITSNKEIPLQFWGEILYPAIPTQSSTHTFIIPEDKKIEFKSYKNDYKPLIEKSDGVSKYTFSFNETNPLSEEEILLPPLQEVLGAVYLSSMNDWKEVADWYKALVVKNTVDDADITVLALGLAKDKTTQKDTARAILEFLQNDFRYVPLVFGDNTVLPHPSNEVFKNRYADSKDLAILAKQMLALVGIYSKTCLFSTEYAGDPQNSLPNPSIFSSVILQVELDGQNYYVDPGLKGFDFGHYPSSYDNAHVLVINNDEGFSFDHLPIGAQEEHALLSQADVTINPDGSADYRVHVKLPLEASQSFKKMWNTASDEDKDKFFTNLERNFAKQGKLLEKQITGADKRYEAVEFDIKFQAPNAYPLVNDMMLIKEEDQSDMPDFVQKDRIYPVFLPSNSLIKNTNVYHLPEGFKIDSVPSDYALSIDLMDVTVHYSRDEKTVSVDSSYATKRSSIPMERYAQVRDFRRELAKKNDQYIIFKKNSMISEKAKEFINSEKPVE